MEREGDGSTEDREEGRKEGRREGQKEAKTERQEGGLTIEGQDYGN